VTTYYGESSADLATLVAPDTSSEITLAQLEHERNVDLEQQLPETLSTQSARERHIVLLTDQLSTILEGAEADAAEAKKHAGPEQRDLQAFFLQSRDKALDQARSVLQKASCAAEANEQSQRELTEMRIGLKAIKSESAAFRSRPADLQKGADRYRNLTATGDVDRAIHGLTERMRALEADLTARQENYSDME